MLARSLRDVLALWAFRPLNADLPSSGPIAVFCDAVFLIYLRGQSKSWFLRAELRWVAGDLPFFPVVCLRASTTGP